MHSPSLKRMKSKLFNLLVFFVPRLVSFITILVLYIKYIHPFLYYYDIMYKDHSITYAYTYNTLWWIVAVNFHMWFRSIIVFTGFFALCIILWRLSLSTFRRYFLTPKSVNHYGKWAIVNGNMPAILLIHCSWWFYS